MTERGLHECVVTFGKHKGMPLVHVPVAYLKWLANESNSPIWRKFAYQELKRRGTVTPTVEISGRAINRASLLCRKQWRLHYDGRDENGIHTLLDDLRNLVLVGRLVGLAVADETRRIVDEQR